ncbi:hypothetical protein H7Q97_20190 [Ochrobactrum sp. CM-21-5]|nr:hypothetical protein [Ochrobactrum sp. CM-21-5]MBC2887701.1 hypothetical protein [Ochrobactrum sp. CM-21-5]
MAEQLARRLVTMSWGVFAIFVGCFTLSLLFSYLVGNPDPTIVFVAQTASAVIVLMASLRATAILLRMIFGLSASGTN